MSNKNKVIIPSNSECSFCIDEIASYVCSVDNSISLRKLNEWNTRCIEIKRGNIIPSNEKTITGDNVISIEEYKKVS